MLSKLSVIALLVIYCVSIQADLLSILLVFGFTFTLLPTLNDWFIPVQETVEEAEEIPFTEFEETVNTYIPEPTGREKSILNLKQYQ